jgi:hypothetical protein
MYYKCAGGKETEIGSLRGRASLGHSAAELLNEGKSVIPAEAGIWMVPMNQNCNLTYIQISGIRREMTIFMNGF